MFGCLFKGHNYVHIKDTNVFEDDRSQRPIFLKRSYQCTKCLKIKSVKV